MLCDDVAVSFCREFNLQNYVMFTQTVSFHPDKYFLLRKDYVSSVRVYCMIQSVSKDIADRCNNWRNRNHLTIGINLEQNAKMENGTMIHTSETHLNIPSDNKDDDIE